MKKNEIIKILELVKARSAWSKGVKEYAFEILADMDENADVCLSKALNGAPNWKRYSEGGFALVGDANIANRLCNASELKRFNAGKLARPNSRESWIDCQGRALFQAWCMIDDIINHHTAKYTE